MRVKAKDYNYEMEDDFDAQMQDPEENLPNYEDFQKSYEEGFEDLEEVTGEYGGTKRHKHGGRERSLSTVIPDFWLKIEKHIEKVTPLIQKYDKPILKLL